MRRCCKGPTLSIMIHQLPPSSFSVALLTRSEVCLDALTVQQAPLNEKGTDGKKQSESSEDIPLFIQLLYLRHELCRRVAKVVDSHQGIACKQCLSYRCQRYLRFRCTSCAYRVLYLEL